MSGFVAHKLSGFHTIPRRYRDETGRMVKGETWKLRFEKAYGGCQGGSLTQEVAARLAFQPPVLVAFCLRTINLRTICESSRFLRINSNHVMGYTSQMNVINI